MQVNVIAFRSSTYLELNISFVKKNIYHAQNSNLKKFKFCPTDLSHKLFAGDKRLKIHYSKKHKDIDTTIYRAVARTLRQGGWFSKQETKGVKYKMFINVSKSCKERRR